MKVVNKANGRTVREFEFIIYQTEANYMFFTWNMAKERFNFDDYTKIYDGVVKERSEESALEELFTMFNISHPIDYKGRSLSVSDIVELKVGGRSKFYYCDFIGWKKINID